MHTLRAALIGGLKHARHFQLALPIYLVGLALGLIQTWPLLVGSAQGRFDRLNLNDLLTNSDTLLGLVATQDGAAVLGIWALVLLLLAPIYGLAYNLCSGGMLSVWAGRRSFWAGCRRFFLTYTGMGVLLVLLALVVLAVFGFVLAALGQDQLRLAGIGTAIVLQLANLAGEYARALAVVRDRRNPFVLLGMAFAFCARHPGTLLLGLLGVLLNVGLVLVYVPVARSLGSSPLVILVDQAFVLAWLWIKLLRLAWAVNYTRAADDASRDMPPSPLAAVA